MVHMWVAPCIGTSGSFWRVLVTKLGNTQFLLVPSRKDMRLLPPSVLYTARIVSPAGRAPVARSILSRQFDRKRKHLKTNLFVQKQGTD
jgi:hypothetical protein